MYAAWTDTRQGNQDIFFSRIDIDPHQPPLPPTDRFEENDTATTATDLGPVIHKLLVKLNVPAGDEDWFRVTASVSGDLTISAAQETPGVQPRIEFYSADGATLLSTGSDLQNSSGQIIGQKIVFPGAISHQTYLIRVLPGSGSASSNTTPYELDVESLTADLGTFVHGIESVSLRAPGDLALYHLTAAATGTLQTVATPGGGFQGNVQLQILDPSTLAVLASGQTSANGSLASLNVTQGHEFLVSVSGDSAAQGEVFLELTNLDQFNSPVNETQFLPAGLGPSSVAIADLNRDGVPDLVVSDALANYVNVLLGNGDGTFQAPRQFAIGAFAPTVADRAAGLPTNGRSVAVADLNRDGIPDIIVTNSASSDVSILLGRGDGTFQPQRRFDATVNPFGLAVGDLNGDGLPDLAVIDSNTKEQGKVGILLGRPDGSFRPPLLFPSPITDNFPRTTIKIVDVNGDGHNDLLITSDVDPNTHVLLGNGDGTFHRGTDYASLGPGLAIADLNGDGKPDLVQTESAADFLRYLLGNGDGTFQDQRTRDGGQEPSAVVVADLNGDHIPDAIVADTGLFQPTHSGPPAVELYPGMVDSHGQFAGFGDPTILATLQAPHDLQVADLNGDGAPDIVAVDRNGIEIIFGKQPTIKQNDSKDTARHLGTLVHLVQPTLTITPDNQDAWYRLQVPREVVSGAKAEVLDFSSGACRPSRSGAGDGSRRCDRQKPCYG